MRALSLLPATLLLFHTFTSLTLAACTFTHAALIPAPHPMSLPYISDSARLTPSPLTAPTSFCKCTCGTNSTIIPLDGPLSSQHPSRSHSESLLDPRLDDRKGWPMAEEPETPNPAKEPIPSSKKAEPQETKAPAKEQGGKGDGDRKEYRAGNCNDCNRQFCLEYMNLPICKGKGAEEIFTTCFRTFFYFAGLWFPGIRGGLTACVNAERDSRKDEAVVYIFIFATAGLLLWAAVKPWVGRWVESARERRSYIPVANEGDT
ncbi:hypothetical protein G7Y79_00041g077500 [Physcia stellaris]|nr:hypothetical protein G7Y79_00041g077500 [Physcia stellaris]